MIRSLLIYIHLLAVVAIVGLTLWILNDLWTVLVSIVAGIALTLVIKQRKGH